MRRHPEINVRKAEGISLSRAQGMNKEETAKYFDLLKKTLMENDLMKKPGHISMMRLVSSSATSQDMFSLRKVPQTFIY
jgi:uncharacterized membrane protein